MKKGGVPSKKGVNHPPLNKDVETIEKLTEDTSSSICAVHPPKMRIRRSDERGKTHLCFLDWSHLAAASPPACPTFSLLSFLAYSSLSTALTRSSMWPSSKPFQISRGAVKQAAWIEKDLLRTLLWFHKA